MTETVDAATLADAPALDGMDSALITRLAAAVRTAGAAAVHALGPGALGDWKIGAAVNTLISRAFDQGATRDELALHLEQVAAARTPQLALR